MENSRFKFRVWDEGMFEDSKPHYEYASVYTGLVLKMATGHHPIEQCTGLKDKNGNLIYENDLIKTANYKTGLPEIYVVEWCGDCGLYQLKSTQSDQIIDMYRAEKGLIIGNIHEQKD